MASTNPTIFPPPPTYADVTIEDERTKKSRFNPQWLQWFLDLGAFVSASGGGGGGGANHNSLAGLQGGQTNQYYHLTAAEHAAVETLLGVTGLSVTITTAKLTTLGANGSMTFTHGILTAQTPAT
jgi:hypothetical protein